MQYHTIFVLAITFQWAIVTAVAAAIDNPFGVQVPVVVHRPSDQAGSSKCGGLGAPCQHDGYCCSKKCTAGICRPGPGSCSADGSPCEQSDTCCSNLCLDDTCITCHETNDNVCSVSQYCCPTGIYDQASCQDCPIAEGQETGTCPDVEPYTC